MQKYPTHKNAAGFTLLEMLIAIAIIGILAIVAISKYNQYKIRAYDAHSKQALRNMHMLCKAYWLDTNTTPETGTTSGCTLSKITNNSESSFNYGFNLNQEVQPTLSSPTADNFCATAKHDSSPNTYSIDSAALISEGGDCGRAEGSVQTASAGGSVKTESGAEESVQIASVPESVQAAPGSESVAEEIKEGEECAEGFTFIPENYWQGTVWAKVDDQHVPDNDLVSRYHPTISGKKSEKIETGGQGFCVAFANEQYYVQRPGEEGVMNHLSNMFCLANARGRGIMSSGFCESVHDFLKDTGQGVRTCEGGMGSGFPVCQTWLKSNTERTLCRQYGIDCELDPSNRKGRGLTEYQIEREIENMLWKKYSFEESEEGGGWRDPGPPLPLRQGEHQIHFSREYVICETPTSCRATTFLPLEKELPKLCKKYKDITGNIISPHSFPRSCEYPRLPGGTISRWPPRREFCTIKHAECVEYYE